MHFDKRRFFSATKQIFFVWKSESDKQNPTTFLLKMFNAKNASGHEECSFGNPVDKQSINSRRFCAQCPKKIGENSKRILLLKLFYCQVECSSDNPVKKLSDKSENFPLNVGTRKCKVLIGKFFCSPCSYVHLESSFENPVEEFVTKCRWFSAQHLKFFSIIFSKCCYGHVEGSFDNLIKKVSTKSRKQFDRGPKKI